MSRTLIIVVTVPQKTVAHHLSKLLLRRKLVASVQISGPVQSSYWWKERLRESREWVCSMRMVSFNFPVVKKLIIEHHPYEVPEIYALEIAKGESRYLSWIRSTCKRGKR